MSTRANIIITDDKTVLGIAYIDSDGHPDIIGEMLEPLTWITDMEKLSYRIGKEIADDFEVHTYHFQTAIDFVGETDYSYIIYSKDDDVYIDVYSYDENIYTNTLINFVKDCYTIVP